MELKEEVKVELSGEEAEKIINDYISAKMAAAGYKLEYSRNETGPFHDTLWRGAKI